MDFYERYKQLCSEHNTLPQTKEMLDIARVTSGSVSGWKKGVTPKAEVLCRLAEYFHVTSDYLLGLSDIKEPPSISLTPEEVELVLKYRSLDNDGKIVIKSAFIQETRRTKGE